MRLRDYTPRVRKEKVTIALAAALRTIEVPTPTAAVVAEVCAILALSDETREVAYILDAIKRTHPQARETGETFQRYGKTMTRWEWLPSHKRTRTLSPEEIARRRAKIAADEAEEEDPWTVHPAPDTKGEFLED